MAAKAGQPDQFRHTSRTVRHSLLPGYSRPGVTTAPCILPESTFSEISGTDPDLINQTISAWAQDQRELQLLWPNIRTSGTAPGLRNPQLPSTLKNWWKKSMVSLASKSSSFEAACKFWRFGIGYIEHWRPIYMKTTQMSWSILAIVYIVLSLS